MSDSLAEFSNKQGEPAVDLSVSLPEGVKSKADKLTSEAALTMAKFAMTIYENTKETLYITADSAQELKLLKDTCEQEGLSKAKGYVIEWIDLSELRHESEALIEQGDLPSQPKI